MRLVGFSLGLVLLASAGVLVGCNKTNNVETDNNTNNIYQKTVGVSGGLVGTVDTVGVFIQANSLPDDVDVEVGEAQGGYPTPPSNAVSPVYAFEPLGLELAAPATFHLPFPEPNPPMLAVQSADPGGTWKPAGGMFDLTGSHLQFTSSRFSYFVLVDSNRTDGGPGKPGECLREEGLPEGTANPQPGSSIADGGGGTVLPRISSGYAVQDVIENDKTRLQLVFGGLTESCVYGVMAGGSDDLLKDPPGGKNHENFVVSLTLGATTPGTPDELESGATYPRMDSDDQAISGLVVLDSTCTDPSPAYQSSTSVTITNIDDQGVQGTLSTADEASGASMTAGFNLKYCPLPSPPTERCCQ